MAVKLNEASEAQSSEMARLLPGDAGDPGRTGSDNRLLVNRSSWVVRSVAHRRDLRERCGKWKTAHRRFSTS